MSDFQQKPNSGAIFKNDKKTNDNQPDYRGRIDVDGTMKEISLWLKEGKSGIKFFSVAIKDPYKPDADVVQPTFVTEEPSDGLPF